MLRPRTRPLAKNRNRPPPEAATAQTSPESTSGVLTPASHYKASPYDFQALGPLTALAGAPTLTPVAPAGAQAANMAAEPPPRPPEQNVQFQRPIMTCNEVFMGCQPPEFAHCHRCCALCTLLCGCGLECCCCYGCARIDCPSVCCAGACMGLSSVCLYGELVACIVGIRMCKLGPAPALHPLMREYR